MDILGIPEGRLALKDSNIGRVLLRPGGVGRNIAQQIARLTGRCTLLTVFGADALADALCAACARAGIDITHALNVEGNTCVYLCLHDETGDMVTAVNDMRLTEKLTATYAEESLGVINASDLCVLDANPPAETIRYLAQHASVPLFLDPVSCAKLEKTREILPYLAAVKPNIQEAQAYTGEKDAKACAKSLIRAGVNRAFVSLGAEGLCYADERQCDVLPVAHFSAAVKTGAGDALCAGIAVAMAAGENTRECAIYGMQCAADFLQSEEEN